MSGYRGRSRSPSPPQRGGSSNDPYGRKRGRNEYDDDEPQAERASYARSGYEAREPPRVSSYSTAEARAPATDRWPRGDPIVTDRYSAPAGGDRYSAPSGGDRYGPPAGGDRYSAPTGGDRYSAPAGGDRYSAPTGGDRYGAPAGGDRYGPPAGGGGASHPGQYGPPAGGDRYGAPAGGDRYSAPAGGDRYGPPAGGGGASHPGQYGPPAGGGGYGGGAGGQYGPAGGQGGRFPQGGRDGGRGGGGGRFGGNKKPHMGEVRDLQNFIKSSAYYNDDDILSIIAPPMEERNRDRLLGNSDRWLPAIDPWRHDQKAGALLNTREHMVRCNHFKVNTANLPVEITHYNVSIFKYNRDDTIHDEDLAKGSDKKLNTKVMKVLHETHDDWTDHQNKLIGVTYDGNSSFFTSSALPFKHDRDGSIRHVEQVYWPDSTTLKFSVILTQVGIIKPPPSARFNNEQAVTEWHNPAYKPSVQALDIALLSFARWQAGENLPTWILSGPKAFRSDGTSFQLSPAFIGMLGYYASLKAVKSGLVLVSDISVTCFLTGGNLVDIMCGIGGYRNVNDMTDDARTQQRQGNSAGLSKLRLQKIEDTLKGCKIRLTHLGHSKKLKLFGPAADSPDSRFPIDGGRLVSVAEYYEMMAQQPNGEKAAVYITALGRGGKLKYPMLPTVNVGTAKKPVLVPVELVNVPVGQTRQKSMTGELSAKIIKHAAILPNDRFKYLAGTDEDTNGLLKSVHQDSNVAAFGLNDISAEPMRLHGTVLAPAKLQYGNRVVEPFLTGAWNLSGNLSFSHPAPTEGDGRSVTYPYNIVLAYEGAPPRDYERPMNDFQKQLEADSKTVGIPLQLTSPIIVCESKRHLMSEAFLKCKNNGARVLLVVLKVDCYNVVKLCADSIVLPTQCVKWQNIQKTPRGYHSNVLMKMNVKMGGVNCTLASRDSSQQSGSRRPVVQQEETFQSPPQSISWLFDDACMVMGVDVNHPKQQGQGSEGPAVAAIVASMDGMLGQYCAHISTCAVNTDEHVNTFETAIGEMLDAFKRRNSGRIPKRIIVYRDGLSDNQFQEVLERELPAFESALAFRGYARDAVKIAIIVCQKRHHTRIVYQPEKPTAGHTGGPEYLNPCVGLCVDSGTSVTPDGTPLDSICSPGLNEFYLNSHTAVLGTSKPCKYSLIYDDIGVKMAELELLTYWMTHLYCRCTRAVSYATPAYYAHWAARRGKALLSAGASLRDLQTLSEWWLKEGQGTSMYFV